MERELPIVSCRKQERELPNPLPPFLGRANWEGEALCSATHRQPASCFWWSEGCFALLVVRAFAESATRCASVKQVRVHNYVAVCV